MSPSLQHDVIDSNAINEDLVTMRDELKSIIARDYGVFPNRVAIGYQFADPGCYDVNDDSFVNALIDLKDMDVKKMKVESSGF